MHTYIHARAIPHVRKLTQRQTDIHTLNPSFGPTPDPRPNPHTHSHSHSDPHPNPHDTTPTGTEAVQPASAGEAGATSESKTTVNNSTDGGYIYKFVGWFDGSSVAGSPMRTHQPTDAGADTHAHRHTRTLYLTHIHTYIDKHAYTNASPSANPISNPRSHRHPHPHSHSYAHPHPHPHATTPTGTEAVQPASAGEAGATSESKTTGNNSTDGGMVGLVLYRSFVNTQSQTHRRSRRYTCTHTNTLEPALAQTSYVPTR